MNRWSLKAAVVLVMATLMTGCASHNVSEGPSPHSVACPKSSAFRMPSVPALFYLRGSYVSKPPVPDEPSGGEGFVVRRCPEAIDWSGRVLGPVPAPPGCSEACHVSSASPDGKVFDNGGDFIPAGAAKTFGAAIYGWMGTAVWSPDSRYVCGFPGSDHVVLAWEAAAGPVHQVMIHTLASVSVYRLAACNPALDQAILVGFSPNPPRKIVSAVRLSTGAVIRQWSFPTIQNDLSGARAMVAVPVPDVQLVFSLNGTVMAETPVSVIPGKPDMHPTGQPILLSTATGQVIARLPLGYVFALNAPGTMALLVRGTGNIATGLGPVVAVHTPWHTGHVVATSAGSVVVAEPGGDRLAFDGRNEVIILGGQGQVLVRLKGEQIGVSVGLQAR